MIMNRKCRCGETCLSVLQVQDWGVSDLIGPVLSCHQASLMAAPHVNTELDVTRLWALYSRFTIAKCSPRIDFREKFIVC